MIINNQIHQSPPPQPLLQPPNNPIKKSSFIKSTREIKSLIIDYAGGEKVLHLCVAENVSAALAWNEVYDNVLTVVCNGAAPALTERDNFAD